MTVNPRRLLALGAAALVVAGTLVAVTRWGGRDREPAAVVTGPTSTIAAQLPIEPPPTVPTTTAPPATDPAPSTTGPTAPASTAAPATNAPATTTPPATTPTTAPPTTAAPAPAPATAAIAPYVGLGAWVDAFDFDPAHSNDNPTVFPADVDRMAAAGVRTLYLQAARSEDPAAPGDLIRPDLLAQFLRRAHAHGMHVVAWFLPHHVDVADDMRHLRAMLEFSAEGHRFDSVALDIEWRNGVADHATRSARLVEVARQLRAASPGRPVGAIVMPNVVTDLLSPSFWPGFPYAELAPLFDVWLPMSYWTNRAPGTTYRDAYTYTFENIRLLRRHLGNVPVHPIGGIGDQATAEDYRRFRAAAVETSSVGLSIYDWATAAPATWALLSG